MQTKSDHWNDHARNFRQFGSPLRPIPEDIQPVEATAAEIASSVAGRNMSALVLGVTEELVRMNWPQRTSLLAVDKNMAMIHAFWPRDDRATAHRAVLNANWLTMPLQPQCMDIVVGDGCYILLAGPPKHQALTQAVHRLLRPHGRFVIRHFTRPEQPEPLQNVFDDLHAGRIGNFHVFKWRLAGSLHGTLSEGVRLADMWDAWNTHGPGVRKLAQQLNWPEEAIVTIDNYRDVDTCYHFPTLAEVRKYFAPHFHECHCEFPAYELGERCPTFTLAPRA